MEIHKINQLFRLFTHSFLAVEQIIHKLLRRRQVSAHSYWDRALILVFLLAGCDGYDPNDLAFDDNPSYGDITSGTHDFVIDTAYQIAEEVVETETGDHEDRISDLEERIERLEQLCE